MFSKANVVQSSKDFSSGRNQPLKSTPSYQFNDVSTKRHLSAQTPKMGYSVLCINVPHRIL